VVERADVTVRQHGEKGQGWEEEGRAHCSVRVQAGAAGHRLSASQVWCAPWCPAALSPTPAPWVHSCGPVVTYACPSLRLPLPAAAGRVCCARPQFFVREEVRARVCVGGGGGGAAV
jgi:hypothetical protein